MNANTLVHVVQRKDQNQGPSRSLMRSLCTLRCPQASISPSASPLESVYSPECLTSFVSQNSQLYIFAFTPFTGTIMPIRNILLLRGTTPRHTCVHLQRINASALVSGPRAHRSYRSIPGSATSVGPWDNHLMDLSFNFFIYTTRKIIGSASHC